MQSGTKKRAPPAAARWRTRRMPSMRRTAGRIAARASTKVRGESKMPKRKPSPSLLLTAQDWTDIFYAVELNRLCDAKDNRENGRYADGVDLTEWRRQIEHIAA